MKDFIRDLIVRTIKTMAQTATGVVGTSVLISEVDWKILIGTTALSGFVCVLMNIANMPVGDDRKE